MHHPNWRAKSHSKHCYLGNCIDNEYQLILHIYTIDTYSDCSDDICVTTVGNVPVKLLLLRYRLWSDFMFAHESGMVPVNELFLRWLYVAQICEWIIHYYVMYTRLTCL